MRHTGSFLLGAVITPLALIGIASVFAGEVDTPYTFQSNTPALADEVNANFDALRAAINDNHRRLDAIETRPLATLGGLLNTNVASNVVTSMTWDAEKGDDPHGMRGGASFERITAPRDGYYFVHATVQWHFLSPGDHRQMVLRKSARALSENETIPLAGGDSDTKTHPMRLNLMTGATALRMRAGDYFTIDVLHDDTLTNSVRGISCVVLYLRPLD